MLLAHRLSSIRTLFAALCVLGLAAAPGAVAAADKAPNFTGTWKFNAAKGENLGMMASIQQTIVITQTPKQLTLEESSDFQGQKSSRKVTYDLGGATVKNEAAMGGPSDTVAKWEGGKLLVLWSSPGSVAGTLNTRNETRSLSADGKTMTVVTLRNTPNAKPVTMVYDKQ